MFDAKWKVLVISMLVFQGLLTWTVFDLVDTAAYLARKDCGDWCYDRLFGYILTNQSGWDTAVRFAWLSVLLIAVNVAVWIGVAVSRRGSRDGRGETANQSSGR